MHSHETHSRPRRGRSTGPVDPSLLETLDGNASNRVVAVVGGVTVTVFIDPKGKLSNFFQVFYNADAGRGWRADLRDALLGVSRRVDSSGGVPYERVAEGVLEDVREALERSRVGADADANDWFEDHDRALAAAIEAISKMARRSFSFKAVASRGGQAARRNGPLQIFPSDTGLSACVARVAIRRREQGQEIRGPEFVATTPKLSSSFEKLWREADPSIETVEVSTVPRDRRSSVDERAGGDGGATAEGVVDERAEKAAGGSSTVPMSWADAMDAEDGCAGNT